MNILHRMIDEPGYKEKLSLKAELIIRESTTKINRK